MHHVEAERRLKLALSVTPAMVVIAKAKVVSELEAGAKDADQLFRAVATEHVGNREPSLHFRDDNEPDDQIRECAEVISWKLATAEAAWGLIADSVLAPASGDLTAARLNIPLRVTRAGSGSAASFDIEILGVPRRVSLMPSRSGAATLLSSGDLYLAQLGPIGMHAELQAAAKEAIACFRRGLLAATVALLGKVSEGAWLELGEALVDKMPAASASAITNQQQALENSATGLMQKVKAVKELLLRAEYGAMRQATAYNAGILEQAVQWSDLVRGSRNAIHFGAVPTVPNTYESVAVLLLAAHQHLATLYRLRNAVLALP
jgi:hypothetical protein